LAPLSRFAGLIHSQLRRPKSNRFLCCASNWPAVHDRLREVDVDTISHMSESQTTAEPPRYVCRESSEELEDLWRAQGFPMLISDARTFRRQRYALDQATGRYLVEVDHVYAWIARLDGEEEWRHAFFDGREFHLVGSTIFYDSDFCRTGVIGEGEELRCPDQFREEIIQARLVLHSRGG
jgi:hypothetical protein